jgi:hypothetical protein
VKGHRRAQSCQRPDITPATTQPESTPHRPGRAPLQSSWIISNICKSFWQGLCPGQIAKAPYSRLTGHLVAFPPQSHLQNLWSPSRCAWRVLALHIHVARGLYRCLCYRIGLGAMEATTELPEKADAAAQHSSTLSHTNATQPGTVMPKVPTTSPSTARRKSSTKSAPPFSMKRAASTPNVRTVAGAEVPMVSMAEKRRNKLGYHRTSVACGQSAGIGGDARMERLTSRYRTLSEAQDQMLACTGGPAREMSKLYSSKKGLYFLSGRAAGRSG